MFLILFQGVFSRSISFHVSFRGCMVEIFQELHHWSRKKNKPITMRLFFSITWVVPPFPVIVANGIQNLKNAFIQIQPFWICRNRKSFPKKKTEESGLGLCLNRENGPTLLDSTVISFTGKSFNSWIGFATLGLKIYSKYHKEKKKKNGLTFHEILAV